MGGSCRALGIVHETEQHEHQQLVSSNHTWVVQFGGGGREVVSLRRGEAHAYLPK